MMFIVIIVCFILPSDLNTLSVCFYYSVDADMEDYGFEYSDEEQEEQDVDIENQYYNSKGIFNNYYYFHCFLHLCIEVRLFFGF